MFNKHACYYSELAEFWLPMKALMSFDNRHAVMDAWCAMYGAHSKWYEKSLQDAAINDGIVYG